MAFKTKLNISLHLIFWLLVLMSSLNYTTVIYLCYQAKGQMHLLINTESFESYKAAHTLNEQQKANLELIHSVKKFSVDSLGYKPTSNFTKIYNQNNKTILWVITASEKFAIRPYLWKFPLIGNVSYKGFFDKTKEQTEENRLLSKGYDVDMRGVSAWSTLGWLSDPVLSNMLQKTKGSLCNLLFHELFHATYYAPSSVDYNENLASFIAHKATLQFLRQDTVHLQEYLMSHTSNLRIDSFIGKQIKQLNVFYDSIQYFPDNYKSILKLKKLQQIASTLDKLNLHDDAKVKLIKNQIRSCKNAWFVDFEQYNGLQDSLEEVFNKNYKSKLRKMVQSLK